MFCVLVVVVSLMLVLWLIAHSCGSVAGCCDQLLIIFIVSVTGLVLWLIGRCCGSEAGIVTPWSLLWFTGRWYDSLVVVVVVYWLVVWLTGRCCYSMVGAVNSLVVVVAKLLVLWPLVVIVSQWPMLWFIGRCCISLVVLWLMDYFCGSVAGVVTNRSL